MTVESRAFSRLGAALARWLAAAPRDICGFARIDRLNGHLLKDVGLTREKEALRNWQDYL